MDKRNCLSYFIPSMHDLLDTKINDDDLNIDDGLSAQDNEDLFMIASMAFLQKQLKRKLGIPDKNKPETYKVYSDMLLFETRSGEHRERFYIRLKNCEKFDDIKNSETSVPESALSKDQMLPLAKKPKLKLSNIFKSLSKSRSKPKKRNTFINDHNTNNQTDSEVIRSYISIESNYSDKEIWTNEINNDKKTVLSELSKKSISSISSITSTRTVNEIIGKNYDLHTYETDIICKASKIKRRSYKPQRQPSKLSVCIEDETESENEFSKEVSSKISYNNFLNTLKANLSTEALQKIISQMIVYLEESPENYNKT